MNDVRVVFMGTPIFACSILNQLLNDNYNVVAVVSQPDKPVGRKKELIATPVKELAMKHNIPVVQPIKIRTDYEEVLAYKPDIIITCAYGQIVPKAMLDYPKFGCINVHASLLPKYRGGAPIHKAVINGDTQSGVTIMEMVEKMDAGAMFDQASVAILDDDTQSDLHDKLMACGAELLSKTLPKILNNEIEKIEQDENEVTYAWNISREEELINIDEDIHTIYNQIRGLIEWPVSYTYLDGKKLKIWKARINVQVTNNDACGEFIGLVDDALGFSFPDGVLLVYDIQPEGKGRMDAKSYFNGSGRNLVGKTLSMSK